MHMLLCADRLFTLGERQRLPAILAESRKYQSVVSTKLAEQVLAALYELLRGFQSAHEQSKGELLKDVLAEAPNHVYAGLLTVLMRSVFVLYAEDRDLLSHDAVFTNHYSLAGLFKRLRSDAGRYPDTMDQRFGAWAQLLTLFRMIHEGGSHGEFRIPGRKGYLFDPDRYNFLEGRQWRTKRSQLPVASNQYSVASNQYSDKEGRQSSSLNTDHCLLNTPSPPPLPRVSDGVIYRVLNNLLILDGERLSYRTLDVEQIGSVYEKMMGFELHIAAGRSIAIKPKKSSGAPAAINLEELLAVAGTNRTKWLKEKTDQELTGKAADALKQAQTIEELLAALDRRIANDATPNVVPKGAMMFQPSDERRRSGSHYTPRSLTEPIVRTTLRPILEQLSAASRQYSVASNQSEAASSSSLLTEHCLLNTPTPDQLLDLKICDPAMGSAAFLVEACRQLGDELVKAWHVHRCLPKLPPDEDEVLHARRLIAQRCLYGVDKNPLAVDLGKLSLWLATLAKDHPFTFLDHSLRCGDSLVGLSREQIAAFHWGEVVSNQSSVTSKGKSKLNTDHCSLNTIFADPIESAVRRATEYRQRILAARDDKPYEQLRQELDVADEALSLARLTGDCVIAAYFSAGKDRERVAKLDTLARQLVQYLGPQRRIEDRQPLTEAVASLHGGDHPLQPFHWQIEFPEVFTVDAKGKPTGGFDAIVGNPPFLGGMKIRVAFCEQYIDWVLAIHPESHGNGDIVAHFFRRAFSICRDGGTLGLIATNSISQGDTRSSGLRWLCLHGGEIFAAQKRIPWPGEAAVIVSVVHVLKGMPPTHRSLNGQSVKNITAFLFAKGSNEDPKRLAANQRRARLGVKVLGTGFTFDDGVNDGTPLSVMNQIVGNRPIVAECVFHFVGGEDINSHPQQKSSRYIIDFGDAEEDEVRARWPEMMEIVESKVRPQRESQKNSGWAKHWWRYAGSTSEVREFLHGLSRVLASSQVSSHFCVAFLPTNIVHSHTLNLFAFDSCRAFTLLQSRVHEAWARFLGSSMKDDLRYTTSDCFETFPFPAGVLEHAAGDSPIPDNRLLTTLETAGREYYEFRAALLVRNNEGLTKTYNRFHDPDERSPDILKLRALHAAMDRAVLEAYGWHDLAQTATCEFLLDYEDDDEDGGSDQYSVASHQSFSLNTDHCLLNTPSSRRRKKPWRYRWPDPFRDEALARLLDLNKQRAEQERVTGIAAAVEKKPKKKSASKKPKKDSESPGLF